LQHLIQREAAGPLPRRKLGIGLQMRANVSLRRDEHKGVLDAPAIVFPSVRLRPLERIALDVDQLGKTPRHERLLTNVEALGPLIQKHQLPALVAQAGQVAVVRPVEVFVTFPWTPEDALRKALTTPLKAQAKKAGGKKKG
jgi:hypothetical protein